MTEARADVVVAADGSGDFKRVQEALDHVPENNNRPVVIRIKPGVYEEQIRVSAGKRYVTLRGDDSRKTILTFRISAQQAGNTRLAFSTLVNANDFRAENLTFENSFGTGSQAVALFVDAERASFQNCRFIGWQDTLFVNGSREKKNGPTRKPDARQTSGAARWAGTRWPSSTRSTTFHAIIRNAPNSSRS